MFDGGVVERSGVGRVFTNFDPLLELRGGTFVPSKLFDSGERRAVELVDLRSSSGEIPVISEAVCFITRLGPNTELLAKLELLSGRPSEEEKYFPFVSVLSSLCLCVFNPNGLFSVLSKLFEVLLALLTLLLLLLLVLLE